jgi:hypothetical protein
MIYCNFGIADSNAEPHYQNQKAADCEIQDVKKDIKQLMNIMNMPSDMWHLCSEYVCHHTAHASLKNRTLVEKIVDRHWTFQGFYNIGGGNQRIFLMKMVLNVLDTGQ